MTEYPRFIMLGTGAPFTLGVIKTLIQIDCKPIAYIDSHSGPQPGNSHIATVSIEINASFSELQNLLASNSIEFKYFPQTALHELIQQYHVDFILVACWPGLLSSQIIQSAIIAALNLHPSLLPLHRGSDPISQQLEKQDHHFGISLHMMDDQFDHGDIVLQQALPAATPLLYSSIESAAAEQGAKLFKQALMSYREPGWKLQKQT